jgi:hypothetical protein
MKKYKKSRVAMVLIQNKKLMNVGIILDSFVVPKWIEKVITDIIKVETVELKVVLVNNKYSPDKILKRNTSKHFLYMQYCKLDYKYYSTKVKDNAFEKVNVESQLTQLNNSINVIRVNTNVIAPHEIGKLREEKLDVIIQFGISEITTHLNGLCKKGIWFFPHDNFGEGYFAEPKFFRSMFNRCDPLKLSLNTFLEDPEKSRIIYKSQSPVTRDSLFFNSNAVYWKSSEIILRNLRNLHVGNIGNFNKYEGLLIKQGETTIPNNIETINLLSNLTLEKIKSRLFFEQWFLAYKEIKGDKEDYTVIKPPLDRFYADPFIIKKDNRTFIFFEEYIYSKGKGDISVLEIDPKTNTCSTPITVLDKSYHLSYPFLYEWEDEIYMIPETSGNKTIELYKATKFPYEWELVKVLIDDINAVDATIMHHNNKFWMFTNVFVDGSSSLDELHIFHSENLLGEWKSHRMNPVISNASSARPAGKIFSNDGKLIRPSQDCSFSYGYSVKFNEVVQLTEEAYSEKHISEMDPSWLKNNKGTHTYNFNEDYEVIDGRMLERRKFI